MAEISSNLRKIMFTCNFLIYFALAFILYISFKINSVTEQDIYSTGAASYAHKSLTKAPIFNITVISKYYQCQSGQEVVELGFWPGSKPGYISEVASKLGPYYDDSTPKRMLNQNPTTQDRDDYQDQSSIDNTEDFQSNAEVIFNTPEQMGSRRQLGAGNQKKPYDILGEHPKRLYTWKEQKFCIKRLTQFSYTNSDTCQSGEKYCGNSICVKQYNKCPITQITTSQTAQGSESMQLFDGQYLNIKREQNNPPLISIEYSLNGKPCYDSPNRFQRNNRIPTYPLFDSKKFDFGCIFGIDTRVIIIDEQNEYDFYKNNEVYGITRLNGYASLIKDSKAFLIGRQLPEVNNVKKCLYNEQELNTINPINSTAEFIHRHHYVSTLGTRNFFFIFFGIAFIASLIIIQFLPKSSLKCYNYLLLGLFIPLLLLAIIQKSTKKDKLQRQIPTSNSLEHLFNINKQGCFTNQELTFALREYEMLLQNQNFVYDHLPILHVIFLVLPCIYLVILGIVKLFKHVWGS